MRDGFVNRFKANVGTRLRIAGVIALAGASAGGSGLLSGCSNYQPGPARAHTLALVGQFDEGAWPERDLAKAREKLAGNATAKPYFIHTVVLDGTRPLEEVPERWRDEATRPVTRVVYEQPVGQGILRVFKGPQRKNPAAVTDLSRHDCMRFVSFSTQPVQPKAEWVDWFEKSLRWQSITLQRLNCGVKPNDRALLSKLNEGLRLNLFEPTTGESPRGLVIYLNGLGSRKYEWPVLQEMRERGWAVLQVSTPRVWWYKPTRFQTESATEIDATAQRVAAVIDDQLAEPAYAVEAALHYLKSARPDVMEGPRVLMGFSAGSLFAPAVGARVRDSIDALVMVGCGENILEISQNSDLTNGGLELLGPGGGKMPDAWKAPLFEAYAAKTRLDPLATVRQLADRPSLVVLAERDTTVPAENGWRLVKKLPGADRLNYVVGHRLMFWKLGNRAATIADWVERNASRPVERELVGTDERGGRAG